MGLGLGSPSGRRSAAPSSKSGGELALPPEGVARRQYSTIAYWAQQQAGVGRHPWPTKGVSARPASFGVRAPTAAPGRVRGSGTAASVGLSTARLAAMPGRLSSWA